MLKLMLKVHIRAVAVMLILMDKCLSLQKQLYLLASTAKATPYANIDSDFIIKAIEQALRSPKHMKRRKCLRQGLMNFYFLRLAGIEAQIHFSIAPPSVDPKRMHGHCWVSLPDGRKLSPPEEQMQLLWSFPEAAK